MESKKRHYCYTCCTVVMSGFEKETHEKDGHDVEQRSQEYFEEVESWGGLGRVAVFMFLAFSLATAETVSAWEFSKNPDRFPSVGLTIAEQSLSGDRTETVFSSAGQPFASQGNDERSSQSQLGADIRLPVSHGVTLSLFYSRIETDDYFTRYGSFTSDPIYKEHAKAVGNRYGLNLRLYFNK